MKFANWFLAAIVCAGCSRTDTHVSRQNDKRVTYQVFTQAVVRGMSADQVRRLVGPPDSTEELAPGLTAWDYEFGQGRSDGSHPVGAMVTIRSNQVEHVGLVTSLTFSGNAVAPSGSHPEHESPGSTIRFWRVVSTNAPGAIELHIEGSATRASVFPRPELVIKELTRVESHGGRSNDQFEVTVEVGGSDVDRIHAFTSTNHSGETVITLDNEAIAKLRIVVPIERGIFQLTIDGKQRHDDFVRRARTMLKGR